MEYTRNEMLELLRIRKCRVLFTKVNGEERDMTCTLKMAEVPEQHRPKTFSFNEEAEKTSDVIRVFDVNADGWRSFKVDSVKQFEVLQ